MATQLGDIAQTLRRLAAVLSANDEPDWAATTSKLASDFAVESSTDADEGQNLVRTTLRLYGGMGSFQDLVLQRDERVLPAHDEFEKLRSELFEQLRSRL